jgi:hypothetical protein
MKTIILLSTYYLFCILLWLIWLAFWRLTCFQKFRGEDGDSTTEVGYEEYPTGVELHGDNTEDFKTSPHIAFGADHHTGSSMF